VKVLVVVLRLAFIGSCTPGAAEMPVNEKVLPLRVKSRMLYMPQEVIKVPLTYLLCLLARRMKKGLGIPS
jgi:hypothetical protein